MNEFGINMPQPIFTYALAVSEKLLADGSLVSGCVGYTPAYLYDIGFPPNLLSLGCPISTIYDNVSENVFAFDILTTYDNLLAGVLSYDFERFADVFFVLTINGTFNINNRHQPLTFCFKDYLWRLINTNKLIIAPNRHGQLIGDTAELAICFELGWLQYVYIYLQSLVDAKINEQLRQFKRQCCY